MKHWFQKRLVIFLLFLVSVVNLQAQLTELDTSKLGWRLGSTGTWLTGNVERLLIISTADISTVHKKWAFRTSNSYQYGTFGKRTTENDLFSRNFFYLSPRAKVYPYLMIWVEANRRRDFSFRYQIGPGVSWGFLNTKNHQMKLSATLTQETTYFNRADFLDSAYNASDEISTFRATGRLFGKHHLWENHLHLRYELWAQPSLSDADNYRLHADAFLELSVSKMLAFRTGFNYNYESVVLTNVQQQDTFLTFGLSVTNSGYAIGY